MQKRSCGLFANIVDLHSSTQEAAKGTDVAITASVHRLLLSRHGRRGGGGAEVGTAALHGLCG